MHWLDSALAKPGELITNDSRIRKGAGMVFSYAWCAMTVGSFLRHVCMYAPSALSASREEWIVGSSFLQVYMRLA
jgi:hypothetical protein